MKKPPPHDSPADRKGMLLASLCFVHCVAGPVLLSSAGLSSLIGLSEKVEPLFLLGSATLGAIALVPAYRKKHGRVSCLALFACGLLCLLLKRHIGWEPIAAGLGACLLIGAHVLNRRFSRRCACCDPAADTIRVQGTGSA